MEPTGEVGDLEAEPLTIEGEAAAITAPDGAPVEVLVAESNLDSGGDTPDRSVIGRSFAVITADGTRITVTVADAVRIAPTHKVAGPWHEVRRHPVQPRSKVALHDEGHVELRFGSVAPGDRVCVIGIAAGVEFVPDTGGPREAPELAPRVIEAQLIGVGESARAAAEGLLRDHRRERERARERDRERRREEERAPVPRRRVERVTLALTLTGVGVLVIAAFAVLFAIGALAAARTLPWHLVGDWGAWIAVVLCWRRAPKRTFPGGAASVTWGPSELLMLLGVAGMLLVSVGLPVSSAFDHHMDEAFVGFNYAVLVGLGGVTAVVVATALIRRPSARPSHQLDLPSNPIVRLAICLAVCAVTSLAAKHGLELLI